MLSLRISPHHPQTPFRRGSQDPRPFFSPRKTQTELPQIIVCPNPVLPFFPSFFLHRWRPCDPQSALLFQPSQLRSFSPLSLERRREKPSHQIAFSSTLRVLTQLFDSRPLLVAKRFWQISKEIPPLVADPNPDRFRLALQNLGPAFIKVGQQLATRPDLLPANYLKSLALLHDSCEKIPDEVAKSIISAEGVDIDTANIKMCATASFGQVYKGVYKGEEVAKKVQRPEGDQRADSCRA